LNLIKEALNLIQCAVEPI